MVIRGLDPERAAQLAPLVSECQRLLSRDGMEAVQLLLAARHLDVMDSIIVTLDLLGDGPRALNEAKRTVLLSRARDAQLGRHNEWMSDLLSTVEQSQDTDPA